MKGILKGKKIGIVGAGNMGRALALGMLRGKSVATRDLMASDVDAAQRKGLSDAAGIAVTDKNAALAQFSEVMILAVKPQVMDAVLKELSGMVRPGQLILSIAAGVPLAKLEKALPKNSIVRVMPNTPALVGKGIAAICAGSRATKAETDIAAAILSCVGKCVVVPEFWMDAVTATSGSGPAYVYYFIEALVAGAVRLGIDPATAHTLVVETFSGSLELLQQSGESPETLRKRVTSPGGTTEAALHCMDEHHIKSLLGEALAAAAARGKELGNKWNLP